MVTTEGKGLVVKEVHRREPCLGFWHLSGQDKPLTQILPSIKQFKKESKTIKVQIR